MVQRHATIRPDSLSRESIALDIRVLQEHIAILREIQAPEELISVAERVAEETIAANRKE
jgi:hypothetical protein